MINSEVVRQQFPSLRRRHNDLPMVFLDGPGGTQMPDPVIRAISDYYERSNANTHGEFITTKETDKLIRQARESIAALLGAGQPGTISLGQNMTTLNFSLAQGIARTLRPGDEILITQLDHEANRGPWLMLQEAGIQLREIALKPDGTLDYDDFAAKMNERTWLVAIGMASNALGTVNDVKLARQLASRYSAWLLLDAVAYTPHFCIDVRELDCDFLLCSAYKFYGPHIGILYSRPGLLGRIPTNCLDTAEQTAPYRIETGTLNHAAIAGLSAAVHFIAGFGKGDNLRQSVVSAYEALGEHERKLAVRLYEGLREIPGVRLIGPDFNSVQRAPTVSFTLDGFTPAQVCAALAERNICAWDGHFYARRAMEVLGLLEKGGVTRLGISIYTTEEEIDFVLSEIERLAGS